MYRGKADILKSQTFQNDFKDISEIRLSEFAFLPSIEIGTSEHVSKLKRTYSAFNYALPEDEISVTLNLDELKNYFDIVINMSERKERNTTHHIAPFRFCKYSDYVSRGVKVMPTFEHVAEKRLCPDITDEATMYKLRNVFSDHELRNHISIEIRKCNNKTNPNCKD